MSRASRTKPSVSAGCGYRANVSDGKVTIYPTRNYSNCSITLGLGNATFTFDASNPPDTITRIVTSDSQGVYTPQITPVIGRYVTTFDGITTVNETFTDANGNTKNLTFKKLLSFQARAEAINGEYEATGLNSIASYSGRTAENQSSLIFTGTLPSNLKFLAKQLFAIRNGYAFLDMDGFVNVVYKSSNNVIRFDMGDSFSDKSIVEFTVRPDNSTFICKNADGMLVEVYAPFSYGGYYQRVREDRDIIRVAGGRILKHRKVGAIYKTVMTDDGKFLPVGDVLSHWNTIEITNGKVIDIVPNGSWINITPNALGGIKYITVDDAKSNIKRIFGSYSLTTDNELLYNGEKIADNIFSLGMFKQEQPMPLLLGKAGTATTIVQNSAIRAFANAVVENSWKQAYINWYATQQLPTCGWAGVGENTSHTKTSLVCFKKASMSNTVIGKSLLVIDVNLDVYRVYGNNLIKQKVVRKDGDGFHAIYRDNNSGKFILIAPTGEHGKSNFSLAETSRADDSYIFRF